jgi:hypothetical protein
MRWGLLALLPLFGCERPAPERPTPPDLSALVEAYNTPTGTLNARSGRALVEALPERLQDVADVISLVVVASGGVTGFGGIDTEAESALHAAHYGLSTEEGVWHVTAEAGGWGELRRRCPGWEDDGDRGVLTLRALIEPAGISDTIWGEVAGCRAVDEEGKRFRYDGELAIFAPNLGQSGFLFSMLGTVDNSELARGFELDLQIADSLLMMRHTLDDGARFLIGLDTEANDGLRIEDATGLWQCGEGGCTGPGGDLSW